MLCTRKTEYKEIRTKIEFFSKEKTVYFLKIIPVWYRISNNPTQQEITEILEK
jgi:hypothetical protein